jgi:FtsH-binding integral membrane protein
MNPSRYIGWIIGPPRSASSPASFGDDERVTYRYLAIGAALWAAGYTGIYLAIIHGQGNSPAWWYVALLAAGAGSLAFAAVRRRPLAPLIAGMVCLALAALAGVMSIGLLLVPGAVAAAVAAARPWHGAR